MHSFVENVRTYLVAIAGRSFSSPAKLSLTGSPNDFRNSTDHSKSAGEDEWLADHCLDYPEIGNLFSKVEIVHPQQDEAEDRKNLTSIGDRWRADRLLIGGVRCSPASKDSC